MPVKKSTRRKVKPKSAGPAVALKVTIHSCANGQRGVSGAQFFIEDKHGIRIVSSRVYKDGAEARRVMLAAHVVDMSTLTAAVPAAVTCALAVMLDVLAALTDKFCSAVTVAVTDDALMLLPLTLIVPMIEAEIVDEAVTLPVTSWPDCAAPTVLAALLMLPAPAPATKPLPASVEVLLLPPEDASPARPLPASVDAVEIEPAT